MGHLQGATFCDELADLAALCGVCCVPLQELREKLADAQLQVQTAVQDPSVCLAFLRPGRIIRVKEGQVR